MDDIIRINEEIGKRIRDIRIARKMSQQELAEKADISLPHVSDIERGKKSMKLITFVRIIKALQVSADAVLRTNVAKADQKIQNGYCKIIEDCSPEEIEILSLFSQQLKDAIRRRQPRE